MEKSLLRVFGNLAKLGKISALGLLNPLSKEEEQRQGLRSCMALRILAHPPQGTAKQLQKVALGQASVTDSGSSSAQASWDLSDQCQALKPAFVTLLPVSPAPPWHASALPKAPRRSSAMAQRRLAKAKGLAALPLQTHFLMILLRLA